MTDLPVLRGERVTLRPIADSDLPRLHDILGEDEVRAYWGAYDMARTRREFLEDDDVDVWVIEVEGEIVGSAMAGEQTEPDYRRAELDIFLDRTHQNQGYGTDALRVLSRYLFDQRGHHAIDIVPDVANERAIAAYRKVGFKPVGVRRMYERSDSGTYHDNLLMDMLAEDLTRD